MKTQKLYIKNMVCSRCVKMLQLELNSIGVEVKKIQLGEVVISYDSEKLGMKQIKELLERNEFELIADKEKQIVEKVKMAVIEMLDASVKQELSLKNSEYISEKVGNNYSYLSRLFAKHQKMTIEQYSILLKMEKVKELLEHEEDAMSEIADKIGYSSVQYLAKQFKNSTGFSIADYKKFIRINRKPLDRIQ